MYICGTSLKFYISIIVLKRKVLGILVLKNLEQLIDLDIFVPFSSDFSIFLAVLGHSRSEQNFVTCHIFEVYLQPLSRGP